MLVKLIVYGPKKQGFFFFAAKSSFSFWEVQQLYKPLKLLAITRVFMQSQNGIAHYFPKTSFHIWGN